MRRIEIHNSTPTYQEVCFARQAGASPARGSDYHTHTARYRYESISDEYPQEGMQQRAVEAQVGN